MNQPKIIGYMKPTCGWSQGVRAVLQKYELEYEDRDIINNPSNYQEMVEKTGQSSQPCVQIGDAILADVSGEEVEAYLLQEEIVKPVGADSGVATDRGCSDEEHAAMRAEATTQWTRNFSSE